MKIELQKTPLLQDALFTLSFGVLSCILSKVEFQIPGVVNSDLREIPFLICLFHIRNPLFIFGLVLLHFTERLQTCRVGPCTKRISYRYSSRFFC